MPFCSNLFYHIQGIVSSINYVQENTAEANIAYENEDYEEALLLYQKVVSVNSTKESEDRINEIKQMSFTELHSKEILEGSQKAYTTGIKFFEDNYYIDAYKKFLLVDEIDIENYEKSQVLLEFCIVNNSNKMIEQAINRAEYEEYDKCVELLDFALEYDENNEDVKALKGIFVKARSDKRFETQKEMEEYLAQKEADAKVIAKTEGVYIGMTMEQVLGSSWGEPKKKNITKTEYNVKEQWIYWSGNYLYFTDGKLTTIQN